MTEMKSIDKIIYIFDLDKSIEKCYYKSDDIILTKYNKEFNTCYITYNKYDYRYYKSGNTFPPNDFFRIEMTNLDNKITSIYRKKKIRKILDKLK